MSLNKTIDYRRIGLIGARSFVGQGLLSLLVKENFDIIAFSRLQLSQEKNVEWKKIVSPSNSIGEPIPPKIDLWISLAPIWALQSYFKFFEIYKAKRILALSSTSIFTKSNSFYQDERNDSLRFLSAERVLQEWATAHSIEWIILRPTLIYGRGKDKNISQIAQIIKRYGFFPLIGDASGLRQPIHSDDVAQAALSALFSEKATNRAYNISGSEKLSYKNMVCRIFNAMEKSPRFVKFPIWLFNLSHPFLRPFLRFQNFSVGSLSRMNLDQDFDHSDAYCDFGFQSRKFSLSAEDVS